MEIIKVTSAAMTLLHIDACPSLEDQLWHLSTEEQSIEILDYLSYRFDDHALVIVCGIAENLPLTAIDVTGQEHFGNLLIFRKEQHGWGFQLQGLAPNQIALVQKDLKLARALATHQEPECEQVKALCRGSAA
jgi:hypothetical protein